MRTVIYSTLYRLLEESSEKIFGTMMGALHKLYQQLSVPAVSRIITVTLFIDGALLHFTPLISKCILRTNSLQ